MQSSNSSKEDITKKARVPTLVCSDKTMRKPARKFPCRVQARMRHHIGLYPFPPSVYLLSRYS